jgi:hypothetical protein
MRARGITQVATLGLVLVGVGFGARLHAQPRLTARALPQGAVTFTAPQRTTAREDVVRMPLSLAGVAREPTTEQLRVISPGSGRITQAADSKPTLELPKQGRVIVSSDLGRVTAAKDPIVLAHKTQLPWLVVETRTEADHTRVLAARPFLQLARAIAWDEHAHRHVAELLFGMDREGEGEVIDGDDALSPPLLARFVVSCDEVAPESASITKVGPAGYGTLRIACSPAVKTTQAEQYVEVRVGSGSLRYPFSIPRRPGPLQLLSATNRVLGLGLGATTLSVVNIEEDGTPLPVSTDIPVQLVARGGAIDASVITIPAGQSEARIEIHPSGTGPLEIEAVSGALRSQVLELDVAWPLRSIVAMIGGGALGGFASAFIRRRQRRTPHRILEGALVGVIVSALVLVLPSFSALPSWARATELGLFLVATLAGFLGGPLLTHASQAMFPTLQEKKA